MRTFFGLDMTVVAGMLAALLIGALAIVFILGIRNRILVKLALRNIPRRPAQTTLIVVGLMLSTTIIAASLAIGDTVSGTIRGTVLDALGNTDIRVRSPISANDLIGDDYLDAETLQSVLNVTESDSRVDGVMPQIREVLPVLNNRTQLTEARMNVIGMDGDRTEGFGEITGISGEQILVESIGDSEVVINETASEEIEAQAGDLLTLVTPSGRHDFTVRAVVRDGNLAANDRRLILPLNRMQQIMERDGQVNRIDISLLGDREGEADLSEEVADELRIEFTDAVVAGQLYDALGDVDVITAIEQRIADNPGDTITPTVETDLLELVEELESGERASDRFRALVARSSVAGQVVVAIEAAGLSDRILPVASLFANVVLLGVDEVKQDGLTLAELVGSIFVTFFSIFGSFSIIVGLLLIFLVFVMLAAERAGEMGIARAVGTKRRHLVQMFTFEGVAYSIGAAIVGTIIGIAASRGLVALLASAIGTGGLGGNINFQFTLTVTSVIAGFSLGLLLTLATVAVSAFRVSKLNIVVAIRGLPAEFEPSDVLPLKRRIQDFGIALISPLWQIYLIVMRKPQGESVVRKVLMLVVYMLILPWIGRILLSVWRIISPYYGTGIPQVIIGLLGSFYGIGIESAFVFTLFVSLLLVGIGQFVRWITYRAGMRRTNADRLGFTLMGALILVFWALPFDALTWLTGELSGDIEMFILSGVWMVASAVWLVMYNADVLTWALQGTLGRIQAMRPILKPAIAYPTSFRFRTGLTVAMFALVIFTLMVFSILNNLGSDVVDTPYRATGGFDVRVETAADLPIDDIGSAIDDAPNLDSSDFTLIAASTDVSVEGRQPGAEEQRFLDVPVRGADDNYLRNVRFELSHFDPSYLPAGIDTGDVQAVARAIWDRLAEDPTLAVVSNSLLESPAAGGFGFPTSGFAIEGIQQDDPAEIEAVEITLRHPRGQGEPVQRTVIGAVDPIAGAYESLDQSQDGTVPGVITTSAAIFDEIADGPVPFRTYRLRLEEGVDAGRTAAALETAFLDNGVLAIDTFEEIEDSIAQSNAFGRLFQAFMGLGLIVGVASLGVLSFRAVVERRLSIGMMRAIGYRSRMIQVQFLLESIFVTVLGTALGIGLGALISWNIVNSLQDSFNGLSFIIPWATISIIVLIAIVAALLTTYIPARQASRIYPSEALRYE